MKLEVPIANNCPLDIIAILSANLSASSKKWVVSIIVLYSLLIFSKIAHIDYLLTGSNPDVGSSKYTILLPPIIAIPSDNFLLLPPFKINVYLFLSFINPHFNNVSSISYYILLFSTYFISATNLKCSSTVKLSYNISF